MKPNLTRTLGNEDRPADEIVITPEMEEIGIAVPRECGRLLDPRQSSDNLLVREMFVQMFQRLPGVSQTVE